ncbi:MAG: putative DNA binding domain-containing protein [Chloroflexi bacterium]|nr:putative DNA binding domain-containing protein [Chloroflexota bacterium]
MDLHLHTPASVDFKQPNVTYLDFLKKAEERNLDIVAFADHNSVNGYARFLEDVESLELLERLGRLRDDERERLNEYRRLRESILILPGFEFTATLGFHILGIFPPDTTVRELEHLLLSMRVPPDKLDQGSGEVGATTDALTAYRMINDAGGMAIAAHANSSHGVAMPGFDFGGQTRIAYTQDPNLLALEVTDLESRSRRRTAAFFSGTKPEYPRRMHCIQGSDSHKLVFDPKLKNEMGVGDRATEILLDDLTFEAIKAVLSGNDFSRTRPYRPAAEEPYDPIREAREQGDTLVQSFHERLHERRAIARSILEDVVALANTNGGTIYIGASANVKTAVVGVDRPEQASAELRGAVSKEITPPLDVQVDVVKSQGKSLLQVIVPRGSEAPYALEGSYIYVRSENETGLAIRDEIVQLVREALAVEFAAAGLLPAREEKHPIEKEAAPAQATVEPAVAPVVLPVEPPRTGVEIVSSEMRKGTTYYSVRDLRNNRVVQNVTRASARRLWQYAIEEQEKHTCEPNKVAWIGSIGVCKSHKRGGKTRYDLVQRVDGKLFVYYGVTEDGIHGSWRKLVEGETAAEPEEVAEGEARAEVGAPLEMAAEEPASVPPESTEVETPSEPVTPSAYSLQLAPVKTLVEFHPPAEQHARVEPSVQEPTPPVQAPEEEPTPTGEQVVPAHEATEYELERSTEAAAATPPEPEPRVELAPAEPPTAPKTRAQEWREILDRAIAEARAAQQAAKSRSEQGSANPQINGEEHALAEDRATIQGEAKTSEIVQAEEQADEVDRMRGEGGDSSRREADQGGKASPPPG